MWVIVDSVAGGKFTGRLDNDPYYIKDLKAGDLIKFESKHIIDLDVDDDEPNIVEKYLDRCWATMRIIDDKKSIGYFYREEPMEGEINGFKDSGWRFLEGDEEQEYVDNPDNSQFISLGLILNIDDSFIDLLEEPVAASFVRDAKTGKFRKELS
jgi:hypothetical protein